MLESQSVRTELGNWIRAAKRPEDSSKEEAQALAPIRLRISEIHSATSHAFAVLGLPLKLRALVAAIIAASNGETKFCASYKTLVTLLFREGDGRTFEAKKCEVRRLLKGLRGWQEGESVTLCTITPGGITEDDKGVEEYHDTEFELVLLDAVAKALLREPSPEKMRGAIRIEIGAMMKLPAYDNRFASSAPTPEELQRRDRKAAITKALKAAEKELEKAEELRGDPIRYAEMLAQEIIKQARERFTQTPPSQEVSSSLNLEKAVVAHGGGVSDTTHPPTPDSNEETEIAPIERLLRVRESNVIPETQAGLLGAVVADAVDAVDAFESVGACVFGVTLRDEEKQRAAEFEQITNLKKHLPGYLARSSVCSESLIVRPEGAPFVQLDDLSAEARARVESFSFLSVETSAGNFQAWVALSSEAAREATRRRLVAGAGADRGASGAMRWPGSINQKPGREGFKVRLVHMTPGRIATVAELEAAGLLAPVSPPPQPKEPRPPATRAPQTWPDYQRCLNEARRKGNGEPDRSEADKNWCILAGGRGWSESEIEAKLCEVSDKAKRRPDYARRTAAYAARVTTRY
jgi:hypothetical protein